MDQDGSFKYFKSNQHYLLSKTPLRCLSGETRYVMFMSLKTDVNIYISNITPMKWDRLHNISLECVSAHTATKEEQDKELCSQLVDFKSLGMDLSSQSC